MTDPIHEEDEVTGRCFEDTNPVVLLQLVQIRAVILIDAPAILKKDTNFGLLFKSNLLFFAHLKYGVSRHDPGSLSQLCGTGWKRRLQRVGIAARHADLDGATPAVDLLIDPDLEDLVVTQGLRAQHQAMVELLCRMSPGRTSVTRGKGYKLTATGMEAGRHAGHGPNCGCPSCSGGGFGSHTRRGIAASGRRHSGCATWTHTHTHT